MIAIVRAWREGHVSKKTLPRDALAGVIVGIVALPLAMAFAIDSGMKPEQGLFTAILAGILVSLFGGSRVQIAGPTGAFIVILAKISADHGPSGLMAATAMAGVILLVLGLARLGAVIRFIPHPVTVGFTAGIGVIIFTSQIDKFFGLTLVGDRRELQEFVVKVPAIARAAPGVSSSTALVGAVTLAVILLWPRLVRRLGKTRAGSVLSRIPGPLVGLLAGTFLLLVAGFPDVMTIGTRFGGIPGRLPSPGPIDYDWSRWSELVKPAFTIAMLGSIESLLSAVVADGMSGDRHDSNQELVGQGIANLVTPFFGGFAATGAIARTATNVRNGGRSPVAGLVHSLLLVGVLVALAPYASAIPMASLAAILFVVAWNMSELGEVTAMLRAGAWSDRGVLLVTFVLTVFVDLVLAVEVGLVLAALLFMKRMADRFGLRAAGEDGGRGRVENPFHDLANPLPKEIGVYQVDGPLFFGVARRFEETVGNVAPEVRAVIVSLWRVPFLDASGVHALRRAVRALRRGERLVVVSGVHPEVHKTMDAAGLLAEIGADNVWEHLEQALAVAREHVTEEKLKSGRGTATSS